MKTWHVETAVVAGILITINVLTHKLWSVETVAALAVLLSFGHASVSARLAEQESRKDRPTVECYRTLWYYFAAKEVCWFLYFVVLHAYSALAGVLIFLLYPVWRSIYRKYRPYDRSH